MKSYTLYTVEGCEACPSVIATLQPLIDSGKVKHTHLSEAVDPKAKKLQALAREGITAYPTLVRTQDGRRCEVDPNDLDKVVKCFP